MNFLAIISLGKLLEFAVNELSYNVNETLGGMLNMTFNNLVELIITILALVNSQIRVVQAAVLGSIFFHILLTFGSCFLFGGIYILKNRKFEQEFDSTVAQMSSSLMTLACITLALPASFSIFIDNNFNIPIVKIDNNLLHISYGTSIVLLVIYVLYLYFKLKTHKRLYKTLSKNEKEENEAHINIIASLILLIVMTVIVIFSAIFLIKSIDGVATSHGISKTFIGMILLPIAGNSVKVLRTLILSSENIAFFL
ncbi:calcium/proton exchanger [Gigaspora margarita]|uniref:Calcium/proton exchanger n=1 Tax=Gigaspora margarita TaxID=4874 RepID=A0A8H4ASS9_GIGMA|nr:calcium/proton exchanger [Gigaspora margarita]